MTVNLHLNAIAYGGDFNPEQWDESYLDQDILLMKEAGVSLVTVGVFSWALLEPEPNRYEFDWLRRVLDRLHEAGIAVDLATGTASPPPWLGRLHPDTLPVTQDGTQLWWGSRQQYNPSSSVLRDRISLLVTALAEQFAQHPAIVAWHVGNEYGCHIYESFDDESAARFRVWLQQRHGALDNLNAAWGTTFWSQHYSQWDEVIPPRAVPSFSNPHQLSDWRAFCSDTLLDLYLLERDILRAANPNVPITTNFMGLFYPLDYWKWAKHVDFVSNDTYPDPADPRGARDYAFDCDLMRSLGRGKPFIQMEQVTSAVQWRDRNTPKRPGQYALWSLQAVAHGADGILNFQWRQSVVGSETWHGAMVAHSGAQSRSWKEVVDLGRTLAELTVAGAPVAADIAIVWDWENSWAQGSALGPVADRVPDDEARAWHSTLFERGEVVDFVHPDEDLSGYRVVIVPALFRLTEQHATRLREAQKAGTSIVVTYLTGYVDSLGHAVTGGYLGAIADILGAKVTDIAPQSVDLEPRARREPIHVDVDRVTGAVVTPGATREIALVKSDGTAFAGTARDWTELVATSDATEIFARFGDGDNAGSPAISVLRSETGTAWYVATSLDPVARHHLLEQVLQEAGLPGDVPYPRGVQVLHRGDATFVLNHSDVTVQVIGLEVGARSGVVTTHLLA